MKKTSPVRIPRKEEQKPFFLPKKINKWLNFFFWFYFTTLLVATSIRFMFLFLVNVLRLFGESVKVDNVSLGNAEYLKLCFMIIYDLGLLLVMTYLYKKHWDEMRGIEDGRKKAGDELGDWAYRGKET